MEEFEYVKTLGEGAYGYVWQCRNRTTGRIVAIKGFKQAHEEPEIMRMAIREVKVLQTLSHPAIIQLIEAFKSKTGRVYMVFPYMGRSAFQELEAQPSGLPSAQIKVLLWQLLQGLSYLHNQKIVHRDIKPANILVSDDGTVKLCDFGFARRTRCGPREAQILTSYVVTRWYRAPEVMVCDAYGPASDIWSVGCTAAELVTGVPLFAGRSTADQLWRVMRCFGPLPTAHAARVAADHRLAAVVTPPPLGRDLRERLPGCDPGLLQVLEACLRPDPTHRPTAEELLRMPYFWSVPRLLAGSHLAAVYSEELARGGQQEAQAHAQAQGQQGQGQQAQGWHGDHSQNESAAAAAAAGGGATLVVDLRRYAAAAPPAAAAAAPAAAGAEVEAPRAAAAVPAAAAPPAAPAVLAPPPPSAPATPEMAQLQRHPASGANAAGAATFVPVSVHTAALVSGFPSSKALPAASACVRGVSIAAVAASIAGASAADVAAAAAAATPAAEAAAAAEAASGPSPAETTPAIAMEAPPSVLTGAAAASEPLPQEPQQPQQQPEGPMQLRNEPQVEEAPPTAQQQPREPPPPAQQQEQAEAVLRPQPTATGADDAASPAAATEAAAADAAGGSPGRAPVEPSGRKVAFGSYINAGEARALTPRSAAASQAQRPDASADASADARADASADASAQSASQEGSPSEPEQWQQLHGLSGPSAGQQEPEAQQAAPPRNPRRKRAPRALTLVSHLEAEESPVASATQPLLLVPASQPGPQPSEEPQPLPVAPPVLPEPSLPPPQQRQVQGQQPLVGSGLGSSASGPQLALDSSPFAYVGMRAPWPQLEQSGHQRPAGTGALAVANDGRRLSSPQGGDMPSLSLGLSLGQRIALAARRASHTPSLMLASGSLRAPNFDRGSAQQQHTLRAQVARNQSSSHLLLDSGTGNTIAAAPGVLSPAAMLSGSLNSGLLSGTSCHLMHCETVSFGGGADSGCATPSGGSNARWQAGPPAPVAGRRSALGLGVDILHRFFHGRSSACLEASHTGLAPDSPSLSPTAWGLPECGTPTGVPLHPQLPHPAGGGSRLPLPHRRPATRMPSSLAAALATPANSTRFCVSASTSGDLAAAPGGGAVVATAASAAASGPGGKNARAASRGRPAVARSKEWAFATVQHSSARLPEPSAVSDAAAAVTPPFAGRGGSGAGGARGVTDGGYFAGGDETCATEAGGSTGGSSDGGGAAAAELPPSLGQSQRAASRSVGGLLLLPGGGGGAGGRMAPVELARSRSRTRFGNTSATAIPCGTSGAAAAARSGGPSSSSNAWQVAVPASGGDGDQAYTAPLEEGAQPEAAGGGAADTGSAAAEKAPGGGWLQGSAGPARDGARLGPREGRGDEHESATGGAAAVAHVVGAGGSGSSARGAGLLPPVEGCEAAAARGGLGRLGLEPGGEGGGGAEGKKTKKKKGVLGRWARAIKKALS